jgi:Flp pilus assembly protein TadG
MSWLKRTSARRAITRLSVHSGQATVEFAFTIMLFLGLAFGVLEVSLAVYYQHQISRSTDYITANLKQQLSDADPAELASSSSYAQSIASQVNAIVASGLKLGGFSLGSTQLSACGPTQGIAAWGTDSSACPGGSVNTTISPRVYVCAAIDQDMDTDKLAMFQVTIVRPMSLFISPLIGKRSFTLSETSTALTAYGEANLSGDVYSGMCPSH